MATGEPLFLLVVILHLADDGGAERHMRWRKEPRHKLVPLKDVRGATGLDPDEIMRLGDTQRLVRIDGDGTREELIRMPIELLHTQPAAGEPMAEQEGS